MRYAQGASPAAASATWTLLKKAANVLSNAISDTSDESVPDISDDRSSRNCFAAAAPPARRASIQVEPTAAITARELL